MVDHQPSFIPNVKVESGATTLTDVLLIAKEVQPPEEKAVVENLIPIAVQEPGYRLYKRRFVGLIGFVILNLAAGMTWPWFGPIANNMVEEFGYTLDEINWLGNITSWVYLPAALVVPVISSKYGFRRCCEIGVLTFLVSGWVRYAGTARSLSTQQSYALVILGQALSALSQPIFQVLGPKYSEAWFDLKGRTTATMIIAIANPIGAAIGQLISPLVGTPKQSILVLGVISTAVAPFVFLIRPAPPSPPTYAGSRPPESLLSLLRAMIGLETSPGSQMTVRERIDFSIIVLVFGMLAAAVNSFSILSAQIVQPVGYSANDSGFLGACLLLSGIVAAVITAPLFDRVFTHHLAVTTKVLVPIVGGAWLSLIWAVKPHNIGGLFAITSILGVCSLTMLPVALELGCEVTRNASTSSAILWFAVNLWTVVFVLVENALRAGPDANPPLNMRRALIFNGVIVMAAMSPIFFLRGRQVRKERDEQKYQDSHQIGTGNI